MVKTTYRCRDNDNVIKPVFEDGLLDELLIADETESFYIIISYDDLRRALNLFGYEVKKVK